MEPRDIEAIVRRALDEDLPDITSESIFDPGERSRATFLVKEPGVIAELGLAAATFRAIEADAAFEERARDGDTVDRGAVIAQANASVIALLAGERTALNLMQRA